MYLNGVEVAITAYKSLGSPLGSSLDYLESDGLVSNKGIWKVWIFDVTKNKEE